MSATAPNRSQATSNPSWKIQRPRHQTVFDVKAGRTFTRKTPNKPPAENNSVFMLQRIRLGNLEIDVFFDSGSSLHLALERLIKEANLHLIDDSSSNITVTGGSQCTSTTGIYSLPIKSDDGRLHDLTVQGLEQISAQMQSQDLSEATKEAKSIYPHLCNIIFPHQLGGRPVDLLIGIKDSTLIPTYHASLPSGLNMYRSPFTDVYGSNVVYGGTHPSFNTSPQRPWW